MQSYTNADPVYRDTIQLPENTDPANAEDVLNVTYKQLQDNVLALKKAIDEGGSAKIRLADVSGASISTFGETASLRWSDPNDLILDGAVLATWAGTKVVRKAGSAPADPTDGTLILDSKTRNAYASSALTDTGLSYGTTYYYRFFPYSTDGAVTTGTSLNVTPARITISTVPSQSGSLTYDGTQKTASWNNYDPSQLTVSGDSAINAGTHTAVFTPKEGYQWEGGSIQGQDVTWVIGKATLTIPAQSGSLTYNATAQTASWDANYDSGKMTVSGDSATNAGTYTAVFALNTPGNYQWTGGTIQDQSVLWSINKATGAFTKDKTAVTLDPDHLTSDVVCTVTGDGTISAASDDTSVATVSVSGNTVTISNVNETNGTATITISLSGTANYTAPADQTVEVSCEFSKIYGAEWDGTSTTAWSRTDAAESFTDPVPAVNNGTGSSPFDDIAPWSEMTKEERTGGTMVKIPKFYYKITQNGNGMKVQISSAEFDGASVSPAHMDRGDGKGERDVIYVGRYHCHTSDYKSKTGGKPKASITRSNARTSIHNLGSNIWQMDFATRFTIWLLYIVEFADWNSQAKIGKGCGNNSATENMGYTDAMQYHTGTKLSSRDTYGLGTQYRWIEGLWDNVYDWCDGCYYNSNGLNIILNPSSFSDSSGGTAVGVPSSGYPSKFSVKDVTGTFPTFIPSEASGSESTFSCDGWYFGASDPCLYVGGYYSQNGNRGLFCVSFVGASYSNANIGCRLLELP